MKVGLITVQCVEHGKYNTEVWIGYRYMGLSAEGDAFIEQFTRSEYCRFIGEWKVLLETYFEKIAG